MSLRIVLEAAATLVVVVVWFVVIRPVALGGPASYIVVHGYSMSGTLAPGDLVVTMAEAGYTVGDAIVYHVPTGAGYGLLVVHRIVGADRTGYRLQGDANSYQDPWRPKNSDVVGRIVLTMPGFGRILAWLANPFVLATAWALVALIMGLSFLADSPIPKPQLPTTPKPSMRPGPGHPSALDTATALGVGVLVGLVVLSASVVVYPASYIVAAVLSVTCALSAMIVGLLFLPDSTTPGLHVRLRSKPPKRRRPGHPVLNAATALAVTLMVGLVMLSAGAVLSPAHAAGLTVRSGVLTAQMAHCPPPSPFTGICS